MRWREPHGTMTPVKASTDARDESRGAQRRAPTRSRASRIRDVGQRRARTARVESPYRSSESRLLAVSATHERRARVARVRRGPAAPEHDEQPDEHRDGERGASPPCCGRRRGNSARCRPRWSAGTHRTAPRGVSGGCEGREEVVGAVGCPREIRQAADAGRDDGGDAGGDVASRQRSPLLDGLDKGRDREQQPDRAGHPPASRPASAATHHRC